MPLAVRNHRSTITCFNDGPNKISVRWGVAGDRDGEDVQLCPDEIVKVPQFLRAVARGFFSIEEADPELQETIAKQAARYKNVPVDETDKDLMALLDRPDTGREKVISEGDMDAFIASRSKHSGGDDLDS